MHVKLEHSPQNSTWDQKWVRHSTCGLIRKTAKVLGKFLHTSDRRWWVIIFVQYARYHICTVRVPYSTSAGTTKTCVRYGWLEYLCTAVAIYRLYVTGSVPLYYRYCWSCQVFLLSKFTVLLLVVRHTLYGVLVACDTPLRVFFEGSGRM